jgi:subtilisin family serine protease
MMLALTTALSAGEIAAQPALPQLPPPRAVQPGTFTPGQVLVGWSEGTAEQARSELLAAQGWQVLHSIDELDVDVVVVPKGEELAAVAALQADPAVAYAEPDYLAYAAGALAAPARQSNPPLSALGVQPNDTFWTAQWNLRRVQAPLAWELTQGASTTVVAVIDSGIDLAHPEFAGRLQAGFDYVEWDTVPQDQYGHGTHVAGVIAAAGDNGLGVAGSAWVVQLVPLRSLDRTGVGTASNIALAVQAAANRRVDVINLSLALSGPSTTVHNAIVAASNSSILIVAAAGNDSQPGQLPAPVSYPAAYPEVIAVAATTRWEDRAVYSNGGPEMELAAPGGEASDPIFSASLGGSYAMLYGTSIAAAHVTGAAALLRGYAPQWSAAAVRDALRNTADKIGSTAYIAGRNDRLGYGRVNSAAALRWSIPPVVSLTPASPSLLAAAGQPLPATSIKLANPSLMPLNWQVTSVSAAWLRVDLPQSGSLSYPATARLQIGLSSLPPFGLNFATIGLRTTDPFGAQSNYNIIVRVVVVDQVRQTFLPLVGQDMLTAEWIDMSAGLGLNLGDDGARTLPLAFAFPFYGRSYSLVYVHANGFLSFGQAYPGPDYAANHCLPSIMAPNGAIFALWDDLHPGLNGRVAYRNTADYLAVEWREVPHKSGGASTFQVILRPDGQVQINYGPTIQTASATVGAESWDASIAWPMACNNGAGVPPYPGQSVLWNTALP